MSLANFGKVPKRLKPPGAPYNCYELVAAAINGDSDAIAKLKREADKLHDISRETILHAESGRGNPEHVRYILREFANKKFLVQLDILRKTALHRAAQHGHTQVVEVLVEAARHFPYSSENDDTRNPVSSFHSFIRHPDISMNTALHSAVRRGDMAIAKLLVEADPSDEQIQNQDGKSPIYIAVEKGYTDIMKLICKSCTSLSLSNLAGPGGSTALHAAVKNLDHGIELVQDLIGLARVLSCSSDKDNTHGQLSSFQDFLRKGDVDLNTVLHKAVMQPNSTIVKILLETDPSDRHIQNKQGQTPIYIAVEKRYSYIVKLICTTCTAPLNLDGPGDSTALHVAITKNLDQELICMMINTAKPANYTPVDENAVHGFVELFNKTDEYRRTILELAVDHNYGQVVEHILTEDPAYQPGRGGKYIGLLPLIYKASDKGYQNIDELLTKTYQAGARTSSADYKAVDDLISAIKERQRDSVKSAMEHPGCNIKFADNQGWTVLHHAAYHQYDSILSVLIEKLETAGYQFNYEDMVSTPFHVAAKKGYTTTVMKLLELWPPSPSVAYINANNEGQNILHLAAMQSEKKMIQDILKYIPQSRMNKFVNKQDNNGNTPLHLLIQYGCYIPQLIKYKKLDTMVKNLKRYTPLDYFYIQKEIIADQASIKIALEDIQADRSWKFWRKNMMRKSDSSDDVVRPNDRAAKNVEFEVAKKQIIEARNERMKKERERYKERTNTQIIVTALITTVTFTVGFTMPGGLHQSGEADQGMVVLSKKTAFNAFMVFDALALLLSTCSLFLYFLESMYDDSREVSKINAASVGLNIVSIIAMMLTFITGTYVVLSDSLALAIAICLVGSLFFIFVIVLLIKFLYDRQVKRNED